MSKRRYQKGDEPVPGMRLVRFLGHGGFGEVWKARYSGGVEVALKILYEIDERHGRKAFLALQEVKNIKHAHLVPIYGFWLKNKDGNILDESVAEEMAERPSDSYASQRSELSTSGRGTIVVRRKEPSEESPDAAWEEDSGTRPAELVIAMGLGSKTLADMLNEWIDAGCDGIARDELLTYMENAASALDYLNLEQGVRHGDVKPSNIVIVGDRAQVCDFDLAKSLHNTPATSIGFTAQYVAPEVLRGDALHPASDQYSLAISYYELLTGRLPFASDDAHVAIAAHLSGKLDFSRAPKWDRKVLRRATAMNPDHRFESSSHFVRSLRGRESLTSAGIGAMVTIILLLALTLGWWTIPSIAGFPEYGLGTFVRSWFGDLPLEEAVARMEDAVVALKQRGTDGSSGTGDVQEKWTIACAALEESLQAPMEESEAVRLLAEHHEFLVQYLDSIVRSRDAEGKLLPRDEDRWLLESIANDHRELVRGANQQRGVKYLRELQKRLTNSGYSLADLYLLQAAIEAINRTDTSKDLFDYAQKDIASAVDASLPAGLEAWFRVITSADAPIPLEEVEKVARDLRSARNFEESLPEKCLHKAIADATKSLFTEKDDRLLEECIRLDGELTENDRRALDEYYGGWFGDLKRLKKWQENELRRVVYRFASHPTWAASPEARIQVPKVRANSEGHSNDKIERRVRAFARELGWVVLLLDLTNDNDELRTKYRESWQEGAEAFTYVDADLVREALLARRQAEFLGPQGGSLGPSSAASVSTGDDVIADCWARLPDEASPLQDAWKQVLDLVERAWAAPLERDDARKLSDVLKKIDGPDSRPHESSEPDSSRLTGGPAKALLLVARYVAVEGGIPRKEIRWTRLSSDTSEVLTGGWGKYIDYVCAVKDSRTNDDRRKAVYDILKLTGEKGTLLTTIDVRKEIRDAPSWLKGERWKVLARMLAESLDEKLPSLEEILVNWLTEGQPVREKIEQHRSWRRWYDDLVLLDCLFEQAQDDGDRERRTEFQRKRAALALWLVDAKKNRKYRSFLIEDVRRYTKDASSNEALGFPRLLYAVACVRLAGERRMPRGQRQQLWNEARKAFGEVFWRCLDSRGQSFLDQLEGADSKKSGSTADKSELLGAFQRKVILPAILSLHETASGDLRERAIFVGQLLGRSFDKEDGAEDLTSASHPYGADSPTEPGAGSSSWNSVKEDWRSFREAFDQVRKAALRVTSVNAEGVAGESTGGDAAILGQAVRCLEKTPGMKDRELFLARATVCLTYVKAWPFVADMVDQLLNHPVIATSDELSREVLRFGKDYASDEGWLYEALLAVRDTRLKAEQASTLEEKVEGIRRQIEVLEKKIPQKERRSWDALRILGTMRVQLANALAEFADALARDEKRELVREEVQELRGEVEKLLQDAIRDLKPIADEDFFDWRVTATKRYDMLMILGNATEDLAFLQRRVLSESELRKYYDEALEYFRQAKKEAHDADIPECSAVMAVVRAAVRRFIDSEGNPQDRWNKLRGALDPERKDGETELDTWEYVVELKACCESARGDRESLYWLGKLYLEASSVRLRMGDQPGGEKHVSKALDYCENSMFWFDRSIDSSDDASRKIEALDAYVFAVYQVQECLKALPHEARAGKGEGKRRLSYYCRKMLGLAGKVIPAAAKEGHRTRLLLSQIMSNMSVLVRNAWSDGYESKDPQIREAADHVGELADSTYEKFAKAVPEADREVKVRAHLLLAGQQTMAALYRSEFAQEMDSDKAQQDMSRRAKQSLDGARRSLTMAETTKRTQNREQSREREKRVAAFRVVFDYIISPRVERNAREPWDDDEGKEDWKRREKDLAERELDAVFDEYVAVALCRYLYKDKDDPSRIKREVLIRRIRARIEDLQKGCPETPAIGGRGLELKFFELFFQK